MISRYAKSEIAIFAAAAVILLAPLFPLPASINLTGHPWKMELIAAFVLLVLFVRIIVRKTGPSVYQVPRSTLLFLAGFTAFSAASVIWADSARSVFHHTFVWACYLVLFVFLSNLLMSKDGVSKLAAFLVLFGIVLSSLTVLGYLQVMINPEYEAIFRVTYSKYSEILATLTPFLFVAAVTSRKEFNRIYSFAAVFSFLAVVVSLSRTSFVATVVGTALSIGFIILFLRTRRALMRTAVLAGLLGLVFAGAQLAALAGSGETTLYERFSSTSSYQTSSRDIRFLLLGVSGEMITANPVIGVGADNFGLEINDYRMQFAVSNPGHKTLRAGQELMLERAHNEFAQILAELGTVGFIFFLGILLSGIANFVRATRRSRGRAELAIRLGAAAGSAAFLTSSLASSFSFRALQNGVVFFVLFAIASAPWGRMERREREGTNLQVAIPGLILAVFALGVFGLQVSSGFLTAGGDRNEDAAKALLTYRTAGKLDSSNAAVDMSIAIRYFNEKDPANAAPYFRKAIDKGGGVIGSYYYLVVSYQLAGDIDAAIEAARECASVFPASPYSRVILSDLLRRAGRAEESAEQYEAARAINIREADTWRSVFETSALETSVAARQQKSIIPLADLPPNSVVQAVIGKEKVYK